MTTKVSSGSIPEIPEELVISRPQMALIIYRKVKKMVSMKLGAGLQSERDDIKKELGLSEDKMKLAEIYYLDIVKFACNEVIDELKQRASKR